MNSIKRRRALQRLILLSAAAQLSCSGGGGSESPVPGPNPGPPSPTPPSPPSPTSPPGPPPSPPSPTTPPAPGVPVPAPQGAYRYNQATLFTSIAATTEPSRISGGSALELEGPGPTHRYIDYTTGWAWKNAGGDWIDANRVAQGNSAWATIVSNAASGDDAVANYTADFTTALQFVRNNRRPNAWLMRSAGAPRTIAARFYADASRRPRLEVTYADGSTATLRCLVTAVNSSGSDAPVLPGATRNLPCFVEFEPPQRDVTRATLHLTVTAHWTGGSPNIELLLLSANANTDPVTQGVAQGYLLDAGLAAHPSIIGQHRYQDGSVRGDFILEQSAHRMGGINFDEKQYYSPELWGGAPDTAKLPYAGLGKWVKGGTNDSNPNFGIVASSYAGEGFTALAPGMGALRLHMPADTDANGQPIVDGSEVGYGGTTVGNARLFLPASRFGLLKRAFVRYYFRMGTPFNPTLPDRKHVRQGGKPAWTDAGGKWLINWSHKNKSGGNSGYGGGNAGWSLRHLFSEHYGGDTQSPTNGGQRLSLSWYDYDGGNPAGYRSTSGSESERHTGQRGGLGAALYHSRWYCIEMEMDLNSVDRPGADGRMWTPDGAVRMWIDGRLAYERVNWVFRSLPLDAGDVNDPTYLNAVRELGHAYLWLADYFGGTTSNTYPRTWFFSALTWGTERIGPMRLA